MQQDQKQTSIPFAEETDSWKKSQQEILETATEKGLCRPFNEVGNAYRFGDSYAGKLLYDSSRKKWLGYNGKRWEVLKRGEEVHLAKLTVANIYREAERAVSSEERKKIAKFAMKSETRYQIESMLRLAQSDPRLSAATEDFDTDKYMFNVENGTIDLRSGELREHRPEDMITKIAPVEYNEEVMPERFLSFLEEISCGRYDIVDFMHHYLGYALTGNISEQCLSVFYGHGCNGKSVFINTLSKIFGNYAVEADVSTFMIQKHNNIPNDIARLKGARLVTARESEQGQRLAESLVKSMTGGDTLVARYLYGEFFSFQSEFKLILVTNHLPRIRGTDHAIWRRIRLIPFDYKVPEQLKDPTLEDKLWEERNGIFRWLLEGCLNWQEKGLPKSESVEAATGEYRTEQDRLADFISHRCHVDVAMSAGSTNLYNAYKEFSSETGEKPMSQKSFSLALQERGFIKNGSKRVTFNGIGLKI